MKELIVWYHGFRIFKGGMGGAGGASATQAIPPGSAPAVDL